MYITIMIIITIIATTITITIKYTCFVLHLPAYDDQTTTAITKLKHVFSVKGKTRIPTNYPSTNYPFWRFGMISEGIAYMYSFTICYVCIYIYIYIYIIGSLLLFCFPRGAAGLLRRELWQAADEEEYVIDVHLFSYIYIYIYTYI